MKIAFFEIEEWEKPFLKEAFPEDRVSFYDGALTPENTATVKDAEIISTFIYSPLSEKLLLNLPNLKLIATRSTGFDHVDVDYCRSRGVAVCNVPAYGVNTVAEHTFALLLAVSRKIIPSVERSRRGDFNLEGLRGMELAGKTLGIIGLGRIGTRVAEIGRCFKMKIVAYTQNPNQEEAKRMGITLTDLPTLLTVSDVVSLHVPLTAESRHLINIDNIKLMKKGSILINTARGAVVETEALLWALERRIIAGAGLDVLEEEYALREERELLSKDFLKECDLKTQLLNHVLLNKGNVIITPHNAFNSSEALQEILGTTVSNIKAFIAGESKNRLV